MASKDFIVKNGLLVGGSSATGGLSAATGTYLTSLSTTSLSTGSIDFTSNNSFTVCRDGSVGIGTTVLTEALTVSGNMSASGTVFADAFNSANGGASISFLDPVLVVSNVSAQDVFGSSCLCSPVVRGTTCLISPIIDAATCVDSPVIKGSELVCTEAVLATTCVDAPLVKGTTCVESPVIWGSTKVCSPSVIGLTTVSSPLLSGTNVYTGGSVGVGTSVANEALTVSGNVSATGIVYADAFNSKTGGSAISFNDDVTLTGDITGTIGNFTTSLSAAALSGAGDALTTTATIALSGDLGGSVAIDDLSGTKTLTATIQTNSVALGTDTTGNYLESLALNTTTPSLTSSSTSAAEGLDITGLGLSATGVTATAYGSTSAIPVITVLEDGRISSASTTTAATTLSTEAGTGIGDVDLLSESLRILGTSNEITTVASNNDITVGLPSVVSVTTSLSSPSLSGTNVCGSTSVLSPSLSGTNVCGSTSVLSPLVCGTTKVCSPKVVGTTCVHSPLVCGTTSVNTPIVNASSCVVAPTLSATNVYTSGSVGIGTTNPNEKLTVSGSVSASTSLLSPLVLGSGGSETAPTYSFANDNRTGMWQPDDAEIYFTTSGVSRLCLTSDLTRFSNAVCVASDITVAGNLTVHGVCTTLNTTVTSTSAMYVCNAGTGPALVLNQTGTQPIVDLQDDGTSAFYIEDGGMVGIGTTDPGAKLHIYGSGEQTLFLGSSNANRALFVLDGASNGDGSGGDYAYLAHNADGSLDIKNLQNNSTNFATGSGALTRMTITSAGDVGIGNTNPQGTLDLGNATAGKSIVWGGPSGTTHYTSIWSEYSSGSLVLAGGLKSSTTNGDFIYPYTGTYGYAAIELDSFQDDGIIFYTAADAARTAGAVATKQERMRIDTSGNVGIGTTNSTEKLTVSGNISASGTIYADAFNSKTGGSTIDFNDDVDLNGNLTFSSSSDILIPDNAGAALEIKEGSNVYQRFITTNGGEVIELYKYTTATAGFYTNSLSATSLSGAAGEGVTTGATIALGGDLGGSVALDNLNGTKTLTATIQANSVALATDTTGNYVQSLALNTTTPSLTGSSLAAAEGNTITGLGLSATGVTAAAYGNSTTIPVITVLEDGRLSSVSTSSIPTDLTIAADSGSNDTVTIGTDTLTFAGTSNEVDTTVSNNQIQIGLPSVVSVTTSLSSPSLSGTNVCGSTSLLAPLVCGTTAVVSPSACVTTLSATNVYTSGSIGIGTNNPGAGLHIYGSDQQGLFLGSSNAGRSLFVLDGASNGDGSGGDYAYLAHNADGSLDIKNLQNNSTNFATGSGAVTRMTITSAGNVGIGTTAPSQKLTVSGSISGSSTFTIGNGGDTGGLTVSPTGGTNAYGLSLNRSALSRNSPDIWDNIGDAIVIGAASSDTTLAIVSGGKVGIGTTSPSAKLDIKTSDPRILEIHGTSARAWIVFNESGTDRGMLGYGDSGNIFTGATADSLSLRAENDLHLGGGGDNLTMTLDTSGNVGIGTTNPNEELTVAGSVSASTSVLSPLVCGATSVNTPIVNASSCVVVPTLSATNACLVEDLTLTAASNILNGDGLVSAPSYSFAGDTNTGMWRPGADQLRFVTGGSDRLCITSSFAKFTNAVCMSSTLHTDGKVGICNSNPNHALSVTGNISATGDAFVDGDLTVAGEVTYTASTVTATTTAFQDNFLLESTDSGSSGAPDVTLYRNSSSPANDDDLGNILFRGRNNNSQDVEYAQILTDIVDVADGSEDAKIRFLTMKAGTLTDTLAMDRGSVGIGTTTPGSLLELYSSAPVLAIKDGGAYGTNATSYIDFKDGSSVMSRVGVADTAGTLDINNLKANSIRLQTNNSTRVTLTSAGNFGIGTTNPSSKLTVAEGTDQHGVEIQPGTLSYIQAYDRATSDYGDLTIDAQTLRFATDTGAERVRIDASGNVGIGTNDPNYKLHTVGGAGVFDVTGAATLNHHLAVTEVATLPDWRPYAGTTTVALQIQSSATRGILLAAKSTGNQDFYNTDGLDIYVSSTIGSSASDRGTLAMSILSGGNVGIGTASPTAKLHIAGSGGDVKFTIDRTDARTYSLYTESNGSLRIKDEDASTDRLTILSGGDVGIGTASPGTKLDITGTFRVSDWVHFSNSGGNEIVLGSSGANYGFIMNPSAGVWSLGYGNNRDTLGTSVLSWSSSNLVTINNAYNLFLDGGNITLENSAGDNSATISNDGAAGSSKINVADALYVIEGGNVGIGTASPGNKLSIVGSTTTTNFAVTGGGSFSGNDFGTIFKTTATATKRSQIFFKDSTDAITSRIGNDIEGANNAKLQFIAGSGSTPHMSILSGGSVGIGTASPSQKLHVNLGRIAVTDGYNIGDTDADTGMFPSSNALYFQTTGTTRATITSAGNFGIGTASPAQKLHVAGNTLISNNNYHYGYTAAGAQATLIGIKSNNYVTVGQNNANHVATTIFGGTGLIEFSTGGSTRMTITSGGNVGIGIDDPFSALDVNTGTITLRESVYTYHQFTSNSDGLNIINNADGANITRNIIFKSSVTGGDITEKMRITGAGNVGIGTTNPNEKLTVSGNISASGTVYGGDAEFGAVMETNLSSPGLDTEPEGTVLVWEGGISKPCYVEYDNRVVGIVKKNNDTPIVLGAEPVLVTGVISEGDFIVTSDKKGHGKKGSSNNLFGKVIAQALENGEGNSYTIKAMIRKM